MFLERIAIFTIQLRAKLQEFFNYLLRETDSQLGQIFFTCCILIFTALLLYVWITPFSLWFQICFTIIYLFISLVFISGIYFIVKRKRIRTKSNAFEVYTLDPDLTSFHHFNLKVIPITEEKTQTIFKAFSGNYFTSGNYRSFQFLIQLKPVVPEKRLQWVDLSPKRPKQVNRQTLLEFLSHLFIGFKNLDNQQIIIFVEQYFQLKNPKGNLQHLSTKNISDWRTNEAAYLRGISEIFKNL